MLCALCRNSILCCRSVCQRKIWRRRRENFFVSILHFLFRHFSEFPSCFLRGSISAGGFKRSRAKDCRYKYGFQLFSLPFLASFALGWILVMYIFANKNYFVSLSSNYRPRTSAASAKKKNTFPSKDRRWFSPVSGFLLRGGIPFELFLFLQQ